MLLITKFNKLIRNKFIWTFIAIVIVFAFVLAGAATRGCDGEGQDSRGAGTLFGEIVSRQELAQAQYFELGLRQVQLDDEQRVMLRKRAWTRLAALRMAGNLGIIVSDGDVGAAIQQDPTFQVEGVFDRMRYKAIVEQELRIPVSIFETYLRQDLTLRILGSILESAVWSSPYEVQERLHNLTDRFTAEVATLDTNAVAGVKASDEEIEEYFEEHTDQFMVPEQVKVRYVSFPISNYLAKTEVTREKVEMAYTNNIERYTTTDTNGVSSTTPLTNVYDTIEEELKWEEATFLAKDDATEFAMSLAKDRYGQRSTFKESAKNWSVTIQTSEFFSATAVITNLAVGPSFNRAAFELEENDEDYFTDAIVGDSEVFVLATCERQDERVPELDEVREDVVMLADAEARRKALLEEAQSIRETIVAAIETGKTFTEVAGKTNLTVVTAGPFSVYEGITNDIPGSYQISWEVASLANGEISEPIEAGDCVHIVHVARRETGDYGQSASLKPQLVQTLDRSRSNLLFSRWGDFILALAEHEDHFPVETGEDEDKGDDEDESDV